MVDDDSSRRPYELVDKPQVLMSRAIVASLPLVGPAASLILENHLNGIREQNLRALIDELSRRVGSLEDWLDQETEKLFDEAAFYATTQRQRWKSVLYARVISLTDDEFPTFMKSILLEHISQLTDFDFSLFLSLSEGNLPSGFPDGGSLRETMNRLSDQSRSARELRKVGLAKLQRLGLIGEDASARSPALRLTELGRELVSALT